MLLVATALSMLAAVASMMRGRRDTGRDGTDGDGTGRGDAGRAAPQAGPGERAPASPQQISA